MSASSFYPSLPCPTVSWQRQLHLSDHAPNAVSSSQVRIVHISLFWIFSPLAPTIQSDRSLYLRSGPHDEERNSKLGDKIGEGNSGVVFSLQDDPTRSIVAKWFENESEGLAVIKHLQAARAIVDWGYDSEKDLWAICSFIYESHWYRIPRIRSKQLRIHFYA